MCQFSLCIPLQMVPISKRVVHELKQMACTAQVSAMPYPWQGHISGSVLSIQLCRCAV